MHYLNEFVNFFKLIDDNYHRMVLKAMWHRRPPPGVTMNLIALLCEGGRKGQINKLAPDHFAKYRI
jgi:hypothetical protein